MMLAFVKRAAPAFLLALLGLAAPALAQEAAAADAALSFATSGNSTFDAWRIDFARRAIASGRRPAIVHAVLDGVTPDPRIIVQDQNQAEFVRPVWDYISRAVTPDRIALGAQKRAENALVFSQVESRYGVDADIVAGIWAMETNFGAVPLSFDAPRALATLAFDQRRRAQFEGYLLALIEMVERGYAGPAEMKSSWAGAMGQPQFMPDVYLSLAADWDGDGRRDIWTNTGDILASIANYLAVKGWRANQPVFAEAALPQGFDYGLADGVARPVSQWAQLGAKRMDGAPWDGATSALPAQLFLPAGAQGPALLLFPNFNVIKKYNNSDRYALCVALLARGFEGRGGLVRPWPTEVGALQRDQLVELQVLLARLGYQAGAPDGMFGSNTRRAVAQYQRANGYPADGYPTPALLIAIRKSAGGPPVADVRDMRPLGVAQIRELQRTLAQLGYPLGKPTGTITVRTREAIRAEEMRLGVAPTGKATIFILTQAKQRLRAKGG
jgi:lytic murein transglycosylase